MYELTVAMIWKEIHYGGNICVQEIYWCVVDDDNIKNTVLCGHSKCSEPATEHECMNE